MYGLLCVFQWVLPEVIAQDLLVVLLFITGHWFLFLLYAPLGCFLTYKYKFQHSYTLFAFYNSYSVTYTLDCSVLGG
jgi:hypothetical protein